MICRGRTGREDGLQSEDKHEGTRPIIKGVRKREPIIRPKKKKNSLCHKGVPFK